MSKTNPDIKIIEVGTREMKKVHVYPLSMQDQLDLIDKLADAIDALGDKSKLKFEKNTDGIEFFKTLITENLDEILVYVTDESERPGPKDMTNNQIFEIVNAIFVVNFEDMVKNFKDLFQRAKTVIGKLPKLPNTKN